MIELTCPNCRLIWKEDEQVEGSFAILARCCPRCKTKVKEEEDKEV